MDHKLIDKLQNETRVSYEEAKDALENSNWNILDAVLYLEEKGKIKKPSVSIFYTNEYKEEYNEITVSEGGYGNEKKDKHFGGIFEAVCKVIDICNNIFFEIKRENIEVLKVPSTVIVVLTIFAFWIVIPLFIIGLFFDLEFSLSGNMGLTNKINKIFKLISVGVKKIKERSKNG